MRRHFLWLLLFAILSCQITAVAAERVVLAVPPQHRYIHLGFDFITLFPARVQLLCYAGDAAEPQLEFFILNDMVRQKIDLAQLPLLADGRVVIAQSTEGHGEFANRLKSAATAASRTTIVDGRSLHTVVNALHEELKLSPAQWRALAATHNLKLSEVNADRRRYGRFGPPRRSKKYHNEAETRQEIELPPAARVRPTVATLPAATTAVEQKSLPEADVQAAVIEPQSGEESEEKLREEPTAPVEMAVENLTAKGEDVQEEVAEAVKAAETAESVADEIKPEDK